MTFSRDELACMKDEELYKLISLAQNIVEKRREAEIEKMIEDFVAIWRKLECANVEVLFEDTYLDPDEVTFNY